VSSGLWLLRHGDTKWSEADLHTGRAEPPLSEAGRAEALRAGQLLSGHHFERVLVSPQIRAVETCRLAGFEAQAEYCEELVEWDYGELDGISDADTLEDRPGWNLFRDGAPGGESPEQVASRVDRVLAILDATSGPCLLVGHGKTLRALAARWLGHGVELGTSLAFDAAAISVLERQQDEPLVRLWNFRGELPGGT